MSELFNQLSSVYTDVSITKQQIVAQLSGLIVSNKYTVVEQDENKPWGAYFKFDDKDADVFLKDFFPGLSMSDARLGNSQRELSPKILLVSPNQRLSWQYHNRRAERWTFLNDGFYNGSMTDDEGERTNAKAGDTIQFASRQRHRLIGSDTNYTLVAEIWQHTDPDNPSTESDIVRLQDDYNRTDS